MGIFTGGHSTTKKDVSPDVIIRANVPMLAPVKAPPEVPTKDLVDVATGAFLVTENNLILNRIDFSRSYNSKNFELGSLGYGRTHNSDISLIEHSVMGKSVALIIAQTCILDLVKNKEYMLAVLVSNWYTKHLNKNAVTLMMNEKALIFIKNPDGTFNPPAGIKTKLMKKSDGTYVLKKRFGTKIHFNSENKISSQKDIHGNTIDFMYSSGILTRVEDSWGNWFDLSYTEDLITSVTDFSGRKINYEYDENNNLIAYNDPEGFIWKYEYDERNNIVTQTNPQKVVTVKNTYDSENRVISQDLPIEDGFDTTHFYYSGDSTVEEDYRGENVYSFKNGRLVSVVSPLRNRIEKEYDSHGHLIRVLDARGNSMNFIYKNHLLMDVQNEDGSTTKYEYDEKFRVTSVTDPLDHKKLFEYDDKNNLISVTNGEGIRIGYTYSERGLVRTATDGRGVNIRPTPSPIIFSAKF